MLTDLFTIISCIVSAVHIYVERLKPYIYIYIYISFTAPGNSVATITFTSAIGKLAANRDDEIDYQISLSHNTIEYMSYLVNHQEMQCSTCVKFDIEDVTTNI